MMRDLLRRSDVLEVLADYRRQIERDIADYPRDLALHNRLSAVRDMENRIKLLCRGGLRVIEGGKDTNKEGA
jgi:hypothetical protein